MACTRTRTTNWLDPPVLTGALAGAAGWYFVLLVVAMFPGITRAEPLTFEKHIRPILKAQCFHCHGEDRDLHGGLDVRLVRLMAAGGDSGEAIVPGDPDASLLWNRIETDEMPEGAKKLTAVQKQTIRDWIAGGAQTLRPEPEDVRDARFTPEELSHWAWQPVRKPSIPVVEGFSPDTPVDNFVAAKLAENSLTHSPAADRRTLIRRLSFDLLGLPPEPAEVARFLADDSPNAWANVVDRMLASPQYGVRWGRHWLDVAGYAESNGPQESDGDRPHAWRYRDYVVDAFNSSKPVDRFFVEQLSGDELIHGELDTDNTLHLELLTATGFLRMAPDQTQSTNTLTDRNQTVAESLKVVSSAMLGVTIGCAQCHDHKYDPIGIDDYYRFRAVFDPAFPLEAWKQPAVRSVNMTTSEVLGEIARVEAKAKQVEDEIQERRNAHGKKIQELKLADVPEVDREATREAVLTEPGQRTDRQKALLKTYPMVKPVSTIAGGLLVEYDAPAYRKFEKEKEKVTAIRDRKPSRRIVMVTRESPGTVPVSYVMFRGNPESHGEEVKPGEVSVLARNRNVTLPENDPGLKSTGRRLAFAEQLTDGKHPLTARVYVNRVWQHHFGRGLVATSGDFGISGERPTHPQLLDWLASDFVRHGWDTKRLHRNILLSKTYRQRSTLTPHLMQVDPENRLLARMNLRRLEAEALRDSVLAVTGALDRQLGGPSLPVVEAPDGKIVIGKAKIRDGLKTGVSGNYATSRRSVYIQAKRRMPLHVLSTFDLPQMNPNCELRAPSTVATQSLWFLNDEQITADADRLADSVRQQCANLPQQIDELFARLFAAEPTESERDACRQFMAEQTALFHGDESAEQKAMAAMCQMLLASNRFLYVD